MATISAPLARIKSELDRYVPPGLVEDACRAAGHAWRERKLGPATTVHLFLLQLLARVALAGVRHVAGLAVSAQALCKAKARLPRAVLERLVTAACAGAAAAAGAAGAAAGPDAPWRGLRIRVVDGLSCLTRDTPPLARKFGKPRNHRGTTAGYPAPKLLASLDLSTGLIPRVIALPWARQEQTCLGRLLRLMGTGDLMLADRGLVSFAHVALALRAGVHCLMRLPRGLQVHGRGTGNRRRVRRLGRQDLLVRWSRPQARPGWLSAARWAALPDVLTLRQVAFRLHRPGFRPTWAWVITTLSAPELYPARDVAELYGRRWQVEVHFRDIRKTLGLSQLSARSVEGVRKEVLAFVLLYDLVRRVMLEASARQGVPADRVSFADAVRWLAWAPLGAALPPTLLVNPCRTGRPTEPRRLKRGRKRFPQLREPRAACRKPAAEVKI
jgi:putative transposase